MIYGLQRLNGAHPYLWGAVAFLGAASKYDWKIVSGVRTPEEQAANYAIGRTTQTDSPTITDAQPGSSAHEYGLALDIQPTLDKGSTVVQNTAHPAWVEKDSILSKVPGIKPAITISSGRDWPHVEVSDWQLHKDWKRNVAIAGIVSALAVMLVIGAR